MTKSKESNGNKLKTVLLPILTVATIFATIVAGYTTLGHQTTDNKEDISALTPEVHLNSEHRIEDEIDTPWLKRDVAEIKLRISRMETVQEQILEEVRR